MQASLILRRRRQRVPIRARVRAAWLAWLRKRYARALDAAKQNEAIELERIACTVDRLEQAARIGSSAAARMLADMGCDKIGAERRRLASEASERLRAANIKFQY